MTPERSLDAPDHEGGAKDLSETVTSSDISENTRSESEKDITGAIPAIATGAGAIPDIASTGAIPKKSRGAPAPPPTGDTERAELRGLKARTQTWF